MNSIIEHHGLRFRVEWEQDTDMGPPWDEHEGHGPVRSKYRRLQRWVGKRPGEVIIFDDLDTAYLYDFAEATRIAKRDQWGLTPEDMHDLTKRYARVPTRGQIAREAVLRDMQSMKAYANNEWWWDMVTVTLLDAAMNETPLYECLGGIESDASDDDKAEAVQGLIDNILQGRGDIDALERITVGAVTYELRAGGATLADKLATALLECADYLAEFMEEGREHRVLRAADAALAEYDATKGGN